MAKAKQGGLGRGLDSLFGDSVFDPQPASIIEPEDKPVKKAAKPAESKEADSGEKVVYIKLGDIKPNSMQPRKTFNEEALEDLAASIKEHGLIQPILVRPAAKKGYELVAGERRWRAARKAGLKTIPAIVRTLDDRQNAFYALIENMQREDLNIIEEAEGIREMMDQFGLNQEEASNAVGKSRPYVSNALRLLKLPENIQNMVINKELSAGHARAIAGLSSEALQLEVAAKAAKEGWSVRQIESYAKLKTKRTKKPAKKVKSEEIVRIEEELKEHLGTKVCINGSEKSGKLELEYFSRDELERLIEILQNA